MNILILSCGTRNKIVQYFVKEVKGKGFVMAADCSELAPALYEADKYFIVPRMEDNSYLDVILSICKENKIDGVLSLIDPELSLLAEHKEDFLSVGTTIIMSDYEAVEMCFHKYEMYKFLTDNGFKTAKSYIDKEKFYSDVEAGIISYPVFLKPVRGSASININKVASKEQVELLFKLHDNLMIQEFMDGVEYGVDCYIDMISGEPVAIFAKEKIKMRAGETDKSVSVKDEKLFKLVKDFVRTAKLKGIIDMDIFKVDKNYYISEVNPRFGGGYPHAYESGINIPEMIINNLAGISNTDVIGQYDENIFMMKYNEVKILGKSIQDDLSKCEKIKIVQICAIDSTMNGLLRELNTTLKKEGFDLIGVCSEVDCSDKLRAEGFNIINVNIDRAIRPLKNIKSIIELCRVLKKEKPDIVHVHTPVAAVLGRIAAKIAKVPVIIYTAHGFYFHEYMKPLTYKVCFYIEKYMAKWFTSYIFTQSTEDAEVAVNSRFLPQDKILAIGNGVDVFGKFNANLMTLEDVKYLKEEFGINDNTKIITFVGRLVREKGIFELLEAFSRLGKENVKLLIVGDASSSERDLTTKDEVFKYKENKNIIFTGRRTDVNKLLYITDIFCLPSYREGMPRSVIEAMAMECAIVVTNIRGCREEVIDGETGFLVNLKDPESIKEKFELLLEDEDILNNMKTKGRKRAEQLYDEKVVVRLQLDVIEKLIGKG